MSTYTMRDGVLRIYDSTDDLRPLANCDVELYDAAPTPTFVDKTTEARGDDASYTGGFCSAANDAVYVGALYAFGRILFARNVYAVGSGALLAYYYNGSTWVALTVTDGTASGGDCFAADGVISFKPPVDWAVGGDASLSATKYYVKLMTTTVPSIPPDADRLWPIDGQYFHVIFSEGNLAAPEGRARPEETPIFDRGRADDSYTHYIMGDDTPVVEASEISFSFRLDTVYNAEAITKALTCGNPALDTLWDADGTSTKTDTKVYNGSGTESQTPAFADPSKKAVCIQILWTRDNVKYGRAYHECYFDPAQISLAESEDGVTLSVTGSIYGKIEEIFHFGYQY